MRDDSYSESDLVSDDARVGAASWRSRAATAAGAAISLVILFGVVVWAYRLGVRDAAEVPVIRAELEDTKLRPQEPGGLEVAHQDRAVYGVIDGTSAGDAPGLAEQPRGLSVEDVAPIAASPAPAPRPIEPTPEPDGEVVVAAPAPDPPAPVIAAPPAVAVSDEAEAETTEIAAIAPPEPPAPVESSPEILVADPEEAAVEAEVERALAPKSAPAARPRPARRATAATAAAEPESAEPRAAALASTIQIQLGAFVSQEIAAEQWTAIKSRNGDLLAGRGRVITPVLSGGRRLFRLRAGPFNSVAQASALCRGLKARNEACIVARAK